MLAIWVKVRIKPTMKDKFLKAIEVDALGSERDEGGCLRFNVLQDAKDENVYYFYEIYKGRGRPRGPPRGAPLCRVAGGGRLARRPDGGGALHPGLPGRAPVLGQGVAPP